MTAKEKRELDKLRNENTVLKEKLEHHLTVYRQLMWEVVTYKSQYQSMRDMLVECMEGVGTDERLEGHRQAE